VTLRLGFAVALACAVAGTGSAAAENAAVSPAELRELLEKRDAVIIELLRRVDRLEAELETNGRERPRATAGAPPATGPAPAAVPAAGSGGSGDAVDDLEAAERALERTLVEGGALLLQPGQAELTPRIRFTRTSRTAPTFLNTDDAMLLGEEERRRNVLDASLGLRIGLPLDSQLELDLPWRMVRERRVLSAGFQTRTAARDSGSGLQDLSLGLAKTILRDSGWRPDLVGRISWDTATGRERDGEVFLGDSFHEIGLDLTATKRLDPLVFVGGASYQTALRRGGVRPGDQLGVSLGALLAASPEASLRFFFDQTYIDETRIGGSRVPGSDAFASTFTAGASVVLGRRLLLDVSGGIGLTDDSPDYSLRVALPFRFDIPRVR
jgi:hypothetical protein